MAYAETALPKKLTAQENGHRYDTGAARGRINLNKTGERGEERGGEDEMTAAGETAFYVTWSPRWRLSFTN